MKAYLASSQYLDWQHPHVQSKAQELAKSAVGPEQLSKICFEFVRDEIKHSWDHQRNPVTCKASEVLEHGTGYCYAKSHLLAALLRANGIPAGLCYQRLALDESQALFCLHGLNAIYLERYGWYRVDARGNKLNVQAEFRPPLEKLAFSTAGEGEADLPEIWAEPLPLVVQALTSHRTYLEVANHLPDIPLIQERAVKQGK